MATITGSSGSDLIHIAGDFEDSYYPNPPYNQLAHATDLVLTYGMDGSQVVSQSGDDTIYAGRGDDVIFSGDGTDLIYAGDGNDIVHAGGAQIIDPDGIDGDNFCVVGGGTISGGNGADDITAGYGMSIDGGAGFDTVHLDFTTAWFPWVAHSILDNFNALGVTVDLSQAATGSVTIAVGGLGNLTTTLTQVEQFDITFGAGDDMVTGGTHDDVLYGDSYNLIGVPNDGGNDIIHGNAGNDYINGEPGLDMLYGDAGNDTLDGGQARGSVEDYMSDDLHGGDGNDTLIGSEGDLFDGGADTNSATIHLEDSTFSYNINLSSMAGNSLYDFGDYALLVAQYGDSEITHGTEAESVTHIDELDLGSGNDTVYGPASAVTSLYAGDGDDTVTLTGTMVDADYLDGGNGIDTLILNGDYSTLFWLDFNSVVNFEKVTLLAGHDYNFKLGIAGDEIEQLDASALGAANTLTLDASDGANDEASILGGAGNDVIAFGNVLKSTQHIDGGAGNDTLVLEGDVTLTFDATTIVNIETIQLQPNAAYNLTIADANLAAGKILTIDGSLLGSLGQADSLTFNGSAETDGRFVLLGGAGDDTLTGGDGDDTLSGGGGINALDGGDGIDTAIYQGNRSAYTVSRNGNGSVTISGVLGIDTLTNVEFAQFTDGTIYLGPPQTQSDFDGNRKSDILFRNSDTGQATVWLMDGTARLASSAVGSAPGTNQKIVGSGDFNGDGKSDILWQDIATGQATIWLMNGASHIGGGTVGSAPGTNLKVMGAGDFDDDGKSDILWQSTTTGQVSVWLMNGASRVGGGAIGASPGAAWQIAGVGDFNDDGHSDIVWQNASTGQALIWFMNGTAKLAGSGNAGSALGTTWSVKGIGDFNGDGHSDLLWESTTGQVSIWFMDGTARIGGGSVGKLAPVWQVAGTGDYNGDGNADILWQNPGNGQLSMWLMDGFNKLAESGGISPSPKSVWQAVGG